MAFRKSKMTVAEIIESPPHAVVGSAVQVTVANADWQLNQFGDGTWQTDAWHFYNNTPELHNTADYIGAACSLVRLYVCEIDEYGQPQGEVGAPSTSKDGGQADNSDIEIGALSSRLFGGPGAKAEILRALGVSLTVAGETYLIGQPKGRGKEKWYTVGPNEIRKINDEFVSIAVGNGRYEELNVRTNMIVRVWTPHPNLMFRADSPTRGVLIPLRQQQELVRFLSSQLVSRLASASLLPVPANVQFPETDKHAGGWEGLLQQLYEAITSNLQGAGTAAMIAPILMPMEPEALAAMANIDPIVFESVLSSQAIDLRKELRETIAVGLNVPMEIQLGGRDMNHWCCDERQLVLTRDQGFVTHDKLAIGDVIMTLNHETGLSEWQPIQDIYRAEVENLEMIRLRGGDHVSLTTDTHRWPVLDSTGRAWTTSAEMSSAQKIIGSALHADLPVVAKYEDAFVELVAWYVTEGTYTGPGGKPHQMRIGQSWKRNPHMVDRIRQALTVLFGPGSESMYRGAGIPRGSDTTPRWREFTEARGMTIFSLNKAAQRLIVDVLEDAKAKIIGAEFIYDLTATQLGLLLETAAMGDGHLHERGGLSINQRDPRRVAPFELAAILAGRVVRNYVRTTGGFEKRDQNFLSVYMPGKSTVGAGRDVGKEAYSGIIWCPVTKNKTWLASSEGTVFFTGNSIWWANEEFIIKTIAPLMGRICEALTTSYLAPALEKMGKDPSRYMFWYDTAPLANSANRLTDAKDLNVLGIVSDSAVRVAGAFHESDAMSKQEKDQRFLRELVLRDPTLFQLESVRKELGVDIEDFLPEVTVGEDLNAPGPAAPPRPGRAMSAPAVGAMPDAQASDSELIASLTAQPSAILVAADAIVRRGLELAGKRLLTNSTRGMWSDVPAYKIHTKVKVASEIHAGTLLASAWDHVPEVFEGLNVDPNTMTRELDRYAKGLLSSSLEHNRTLLAGFLDSAGLR